MKLNALGGNYAIDPRVNTRRALNCYLERNEGGGDGDNGFILRSTFGLVEEAAFSFSNTAAIHRTAGKIGSAYVIYVVDAGILYSIRYDQVLGTVGAKVAVTGSASNIQENVIFCGNETTQIMLRGDLVPSSAYVINVAANTMSLMTGQPTEVMNGLGGEFINGRWVIIGSDKRIYYSDLNSPTFDAINYFELSRGFPVEMIVDNNNDLVVYSNEHSETFVPSDSLETPLERQINLTGDVGSATYSPSLKTLYKINNVKYWIGQNSNKQYAVYRSNGNQSQKISNEYIDKILNENPSEPGLKNIESTVYTYQHRGHNFYSITLVAAVEDVAQNTTFVFDTATELWHEREDAYRVSSTAFNFICLYGQQRIYRITHANSLWLGNNITHSFEFEPIYDPNDFNKIFHYEMRVKCRPVTNSPSLGLAISNDGGASFPMIRGGFSNIDGYVRYNMLGSSNKRAYRLEIFDDAPFPITGITSPNMKIGKK